MASSSNHVDIVACELETLDNTGITAIELSKILNMEKKLVNNALYTIQRNGGVYSTEDNPPKWFVTNKNTDSDGDESDTRDTTSLIKEYQTGMQAFEDVIPSKKLIDWKDVNPITVINEYCQITNRSATYSIDSKGPSNNPTFYARVIIDGRIFDIAEGKTKKEAKNKAAKLAVDKLFEHITISF
ncbi:dsRNA-binding protein IFN resistance/PKR inhibitor [NY_014 poxvirus]|uniref:dsRNA-binding protein IFN resistance/PKR inhibitor n=1 Tax=NY_014 poxvirus TaxID=2025360 RepID=UPI000B99FD44|nr:dsRNA-binding protein IFN resistance/PKR inhibitor [NY_014 poxvirus]AST09452.1 dsRNA-binding protein IFN resistance/PKR inhibitor [NY_014 poxvirus]